MIEIMLVAILIFIFLIYRELKGTTTPLQTFFISKAIVFYDEQLKKLHDKTLDPKIYDNEKALKEVENMIIQLEIEKENKINEIRKKYQ